MGLFRRSSEPEEPVTDDFFPALPSWGESKYDGYGSEAPREAQPESFSLPEWMKEAAQKEKANAKIQPPEPTPPPLIGDEVYNPAVAAPLDEGPPRSKRWVWIVALLLVATLCAGTGVALALKRGHKTTEPTLTTTTEVALTTPAPEESTTTTEVSETTTTVAESTTTTRPSTTTTKPRKPTTVVTTPPKKDSTPTTAAPETKRCIIYSDGTTENCDGIDLSNEESEIDVRLPDGTYIKCKFNDKACRAQGG